MRQRNYLDEYRRQLKMSSRKCERESLLEIRFLLQAKSHPPELGTCRTRCITSRSLIAFLSFLSVSVEYRWAWSTQAYFDPRVA